MLLAATVIDSGIMAERLAGGNLGIVLIANIGITVAVLATLIALFGRISDADFNPPCRSSKPCAATYPMAPSGTPHT